MGECDLESLASRKDSLSHVDLDFRGKKETVDSLVKAYLEAGKIHNAWRLYIRAHSANCCNSQCLEIVVDGVVQKARDTLPKTVALNIDYLLCSMCQDIMTDPVTLKCGHTFSKKCIPMNTNSFNCKKCDRTYSIAYLSQLKTNVMILALLEKFSVNDIPEKKENIKESKENTSEGISDSDVYLVAKSSRKEIHTNQDLKSAKVLCCPAPWEYFKKGDFLVNKGKYEEAIEAYLICFTLDSNFSEAKKKATKLFHALLMLYSMELRDCSCRARFLSLKKNTPLSESNGSLSSVESSDSYVISDNCISNDGNEAEHSIECTERRNLHHILEKFYDAIEKISEKSAMARRFALSSHDKQDFECPLCMRVLWEPVTTTCGHTFCRVCLNRWFDHQPTCPLCKTSLATFLAEHVHNTTEFLELAIKNLLPGDYTERQSVYKAEMEELAKAGTDPEHFIPIFVCTVAFPTVPCPLHVFEPRYRLMIRQCMESGSKQFGMCAYVDNNIAEYGTMVEIKDVYYIRDGRSIVTTTGSRRFRILQKGHRDGYHTASVEFLRDEPLVDINLQDLRERNNQAYKVSQAWFMSLPLSTKDQITQHFGPMPAVETDYFNSCNGPSWLWWLLAVLPLDQKSQLVILSMTSLPRRLNTLYRLLLHLFSTALA